MNRETLLITIYCMVDDFCAQPQVAAQLRRSGRKPKLSDEAILSLGLLQEFTGIVDEDDYWGYVCNTFESYFPGQLVDRSQYNRRKKNLNPLINLFRSQLTKQLPTVPDHHIIDCVGTSVSTVTKFFGSRKFPNAGIGFCASKQLYYAGYKTATIVSFTGVLEDFVVGSAEPHDTPYGEALLAVQAPGIYLGDKGFIMKPEEQQLLEDNGVQLLTAKRKNMKASTPDYVKKLLKQFRSMVETINGHLTELFSYNKPGGKSERGVLSRLNYKLAAHTTGQVILQRLGRSITNLDWLTGVC
jgi:DDE family transposase